jgi:hypothetical protein
LTSSWDQIVPAPAGPMLLGADWPVFCLLSPEVACCTRHRNCR